MLQCWDRKMNAKKFTNLSRHISKVFSVKTLKYLQNFNNEGKIPPPVPNIIFTLCLKDEEWMVKM